MVIIIIQCHYQNYLLHISDNCLVQSINAKPRLKMGNSK